MNIFEKDKAYIMGTYARREVVFTEGCGSYLYDADGREYIDFGSGIAVAGLGHKNEGWLNAVTNQLSKLPHISNLYYTTPAAELAEALISRTLFNKVFFCNSGAEANECAMKIARKYAYDKGVPAGEIIALENSFHGRTMNTLSATGQASLQKPCFAPYMQGIVFVPANNLDAFYAAAGKNTAAVMMELVQGEGGVNALDKDYVLSVADYCKRNDILLIIDEVQTGNGRTGSLYAYMAYGIKPNIITTAKGLGNGLPIGAVMADEKTAGVLSLGDHGSTFGGNPAVCAGALAVLSQIDDKLLAGVKEREAIIRDALSGLGKVRGISGMGLMLGIETDNAAAAVDECLKRGLVVLTAHEKLRLLPALNIEIETLKRGLQILTEVLK